MNNKHFYITEQQFRKFIKMLLINENVYVDSVRNGKANLTYTKNINRNKNTQNPFDYLKTDKMDQQNSDTYEVKLKGGIICYNITSIKGDKVMHYFKNVWGDKKRETINIKDKNGDVNEYELTMLDSQLKNFLTVFKEKVGFVIKHCLQEFKNNNPNFIFKGFSIYPVDSSSKFNKKMADLLSETGFYGYPVQVINQEILKKNLDNIERDEEFIEKNKDFFNKPYYYNDEKNKTSINDYVNNALNRLRSINKAQNEINIDEINNTCKKLLQSLNNYHTALKQGNRNYNRLISTIVDTYKKYYDLTYVLEKSQYYNTIEQEYNTIQSRFIAHKIKYSKGPSIDKRSDELWQLVKPYLRGEISKVSGKTYKKIDLVYYEKSKHEIKKLKNSQRMGLKNLFQFNTSPDKLDMVKQELEKIKGTIFIIFDDNISGGATLSDICYQCKQNGIKNIIPITFGEMSESWTEKTKLLTMPEMENGHAKWNF